MTVDKFNSHILNNQIKNLHSIPKSECIVYIHGKGKGSQKFQDPFYTFILENNSTEYTIPIKKGVITNVAFYPTSIIYHYNGSGQTKIGKLMNKTVFKGDRFVFESTQLYPEDKLYIELTLESKNDDS